MNFKELKEKIEQAKNKKILMLPSSFSINDEIRIVSILYEYMIYCSDIKSINDLYNIINEYHLDVNLFNNPWHYKDVPCERLFWKAAKGTGFYGDLKRQQAGFDEEKQKADHAKVDALIKKAARLGESKAPILKMHED